VFSGQILWVAGIVRVGIVMSTTNKIIHFFALKQSLVALLAMGVLIGLGEKMAERFLPIYLLALGGGIMTIGLLNGMDNLLSALYSFPGGYLSDRLGMIYFAICGKNLGVIGKGRMTSVSL